MKVFLHILSICILGLCCKICVGPVDLEITAEGTYSINFMPAIPPDGEHLHTTITVTVTNLSSVDAKDFVATKATFYYPGTTDVFDTAELSGPSETISAGETEILDYLGGSSKTYTQETLDADSLYAEVHVKWCGGKKIITIPPEGIAMLW
jgi:hypothetical protein